MRKIKIPVVVIVSVILGFFNNACSEPKATTVITNNKTEYSDTLAFLWETSAGLKTPESVKYDSVNQILYVSNINGKPADKDGNGFISKVSLNGKIIKKKWVTGLNAPKGTGIYKGSLFVADIDELAEISISEGKIIKRYQAADAKFLNDIDIDETGNVYVSDTETGKIWVLKNETFNVWLQSPEFVSPNGLFVYKGNLLVGTGNKILSADIKTKNIKTYIDNTGGIDGLESIGKSQFIFSDWSGHIHISNSDKNIKLVLNTAKDTVQAADIEYCADKDMILVPTFYHNTVTAYKIIRK
ncbi:MAG: hypothetical protein L3J56_07190 [Bacteroidales bacterium]|nr:hypothetical protein [Bacteroidales bacterium]